MQIAIITVGSRGDVQPYVALGKGLRSAGHSVQVLSHPPFEGLVRDEGLDFASLGGHPGALVDSHFQRSAPGELTRREQRGGMMEELTAEMQEMTERSWQATQDADALLLSTFGILIGMPIADKRRIPAFAAYLQPIVGTAEFPPLAFVPQLPPRLGALGRHYNRLAWKVMSFGFSQMMSKPVAKARQALNLPVESFGNLMRRLETPILFGWSPSFLAQPKDWPPNCQVTGYWFLDTSKDWQPPRALLDFLGAGAPPVYVGFGSMPGLSPREMTDLIVASLRRAGQRGIVLAEAGTVSRERLPGDVFVVDSIPHDWLFPRGAAVVHHGGAGTTAAGLRAGRPTVVIPLIADQPFWGNRVYERGLGPRPIPQKRLSPETLAVAIGRAATDPGMRAAADALGAKIREEDGVGAAIEIVSRYLRSAR